MHRPPTFGNLAPTDGICRPPRNPGVTGHERPRGQCRHRMARHAAHGFLLGSRYMSKIEQTMLRRINHWKNRSTTGKNCMAIFIIVKTGALGKKIIGGGFPRQQHWKIRFHKNPPQIVSMPILPKVIFLCLWEVAICRVPILTPKTKPESTRKPTPR